MIKAINKIIRWVCFTVLSAFLPLISIGIVSLFWGLDRGENRFASEILFACIVISSTTLRTLIINKKDKIQTNDKLPQSEKNVLQSEEGLSQTIWELLYLASFLTIVLPAILYGGILIDNKAEYMGLMPVSFLVASLISGVAGVISFE